MLQFIKYNNATVFIILFVFIIGSGVMAAETGALGEKETRTEGVDNIMLLNADLDNLDMDYRIGDIQEDDEYYYITYTFIDLARKDNAWQYLMQQKIRKVSKKFRGDLGLYLAEELNEEYEQKIKDLEKEQSKALNKGQEKRIEVIEYSGLVGKVLNMTTKVFPSYQVVKRREIPSPKVLPSITNTVSHTVESVSSSTPEITQADNLVDVYNDYVQTHIEEIIELNINLATSTKPIATSTQEDIVNTDIAISTATTTQEIIIEGPVIAPATSTTENLEVLALEEPEPDVVIIDLLEYNATSTN